MYHIKAKSVGVADEVVSCHWLEKVRLGVDWTPGQEMMWFSKELSSLGIGLKAQCYVADPVASFHMGFISSI